MAPWAAVPMGCQHPLRLDQRTLRRRPMLLGTQSQVQGLRQQNAGTLGSAGASLAGSQVNAALP